MFRKWLFAFAIVLAVVAAPGLAAAQVAVRVTVPEVRVRLAPPEPRVEVQPPRPSPHHEWAPGHWAWRENAHVWIPGEWMTPPRDGMVWENARWNQRRGGWYFTEGHWRWANAPTPTEVYEPAPTEEAVVVEHRPPRDIVEVRSERPFHGAVWINGYWGWNGSRHTWVAGRWSAPRRGAVWVPDHWTRDGHDHDHWVLARGHWRNR